jgi:hypothetical protein
MAHRMLGTGPMRTALALVLVGASASSAFAGGFVGLGVGTGAASSGDFDIDEDGRSFRLMGGYRFGGLSVGAISVEGMGTRYGMVTPDGGAWTGTTLAIAGRYNFPLGEGFEVFGRAGLQRTDLSNDESGATNAGNGFLLGAGAEFRIPTGSVGLSLFVDYTIYRTSVSNEVYSDLGLTSRIWTLGALVSF